MFIGYINCRIFFFSKMSEPANSGCTPPKKKVKIWYQQAFKAEWLTNPDFKGWLKPDTKNKYAAFCSVCDCKLKNSNKSSLVSHKSTSKHVKNFSAKKSATNIQCFSEKSKAKAKGPDSQGKTTKPKAELILSEFVTEHGNDETTFAQAQNRTSVCVLLAAGHSQHLSEEIEKNASEHYKSLKGKPKALLPAPGGKCVLDYWWDAIKMRQLFNEVYLVTNADKYKHFERWATASDFPTDNLINDGSTLPTNALGALADFELVLRTKNLWNNDVMVIAGDMLFQDCKFDMAQVLAFFHHNAQGDLAIYYEMHESETTNSRGIVEVCSHTNRIKKFLEKPNPPETESRFASVVFYCLRPQTLQKITNYLHNFPEFHHRSFGSFMQWLINEENVTFYGMKLPTGFHLIGDVGLKEYESWFNYFAKQATSCEAKGPITKRAYARVGLMGNPSDGFYGKTIALSIKNFWAEVTIEESATLRLLPHPLNDPTEFGSLSDLHCISSREGYLGGLRLLQATCKKFYNFCEQRGIALGRRNFTLSYDTNIPRQVGLAGSSAIVTATLKSLMAFFNVTESDLSKAMQPQFILEVEKEELMINAGLQDRVVQVYEGLVYMDFSKELMTQQGHGNYEYINIPTPELPQFFLAYLSNPSDSGKIHSNVVSRFEAGDEVILDGMSKLAQITDEALVAIQERQWETLAELMKQNFSLRRQMYGDAALGPENLKMVSLGQKFGAAVKFPGSGGAIIGLLNDSKALEKLKQEYQSEGCVFVNIIPNLPEGSSSQELRQWVLTEFYVS